MVDFILQYHDQFEFDSTGTIEDLQIGQKEGFLNELTLALKLPLNDKTRFNRINQIAQSLTFEGYKNGYEGRMTIRKEQNAPALIQIKDEIFKTLGTAQLDVSQNMEIFLRLTRTGPTLSSDAFFESHLRRHFTSPKDLARVKRWLRDKRFKNDDYRLELTQKVMAEEIENLAKSPHPDYKKILVLVQDLDACAPAGSLEKDNFLENLGVKFHLSGRYLQGLIEDFKSMNWRRENPFLINFGSAMAESVSDLSPKSRYEFIQFLMDPEASGGQLPQELVERIESGLFEAGKKDLASVELGAIKATAMDKAQQIKINVEAQIKGTSPFERIPMIEVIMTNGRSSLVNSPDYPLNLIRNLLKIPAESDEEKYIRAYLDINPKWTNSVTLGYLLSQKSKDKRDINSLFEAFNTVGRKFGQASSFWEIFGKENAIENAKLKDQAKPMTWAEVEKNLSPNERELIKHPIKVLGSASGKTVYLVLLKDDTLAALAVQPENIQQQIKSDLDLAERYLERLKYYGISHSNSAFLNLLIKSFKKNLASEVQIDQEVPKLQKVNEILGKINDLKLEEMKDITFETPEVITKFKPRANAALFSVADAVPFRELTAEQQARVGPAIVQASIKMLFQFGWFDADRHRGQWFVNFKEDGKIKITFLDAGQLTFYSPDRSWKWDPRLSLARFIEALNAKDAKSIVHYASLMLDEKESKKIDNPVELENSIKEILAKSEKRNPDSREELQEIISLLAEKDIILDDIFSFGALKGLMTLKGENFVNESSFEAILKSEIKDLYKAKWPAMVFSKSIKKSSSKGRTEPSYSTAKCNKALQH